MFQRALGLAITMRMVTEASFAGFLWGPNSIAVEGAVRKAFGPAIGGAGDQLFQSLAGTYGVLAVLTAGARGLLFQRFTRLSAVLACAAFTILGLRLPELSDGGDNLATLALLYMMGMLPAGATAASGSVRSWIHNLSVAAVVTQVCIVCFVAGFMKIQGESWHNGTALYLISQVEWFSTPATRDLFANPLVTIAGVYSTMLFQIWFPVSLFSRFKLAFIAIAVCFHVGIAVVMGLLTFSIIMAGADLALISDSEYAALRRRAARVWARVQAHRLRVTTPAILFIDGDCAICRNFGARVAAADAGVEVRSFRDSVTYLDYGISEVALEHRMQMVLLHSSADIVSGFDVVQLLAWRTRRCWIALPFLLILGRIGLGAAAYRWFAGRRYFWSARACGGGCSVRNR